MLIQKKKTLERKSKEKLKINKTEKLEFGNVDKKNNKLTSIYIYIRINKIETVSNISIDIL